MLTSDSDTDSGWLDSHCHLNDIPHTEHAWQQARARSVRQFIVPGTHPDQWESVASLQLPDVKIALGTHPWFTKNPKWEATELERAIRQTKVIAVGEIGLDYYAGYPPRPDKTVQLDIFERQLRIAKTHDLPVIIHSVKAHQDIIRLLKKHRIEKGVVHAFAGSQELAQQFIDCGMFLGIGPQLLRSKKLASVFGLLPRDRVLVETDSPYMSLSLESENPLLDLLSVVKFCAELWQLEASELAAQFAANAQQLFGDLD
jgi:TatD DNase family protein